MEPTDLTIEILKSIRDEVRITNERIDGVREDVKSVRNEVRLTNERVDALRDQQVRTEIRLATELVTVAGEFRALREDLRSAGVRARLDDHEQRIGALENRTG